MDFLFEYLMFLGQVVTLVIAFLVIASSLAGLSARQQGGDHGHLVIRKLNERVRELRFAMENHSIEYILTPPTHSQPLTYYSSTTGAIS